MSANRLLEGIVAACDRLCLFPLLGPERPLLGPGLRVIFESHYAIYYVASERYITVIRVLHGARDAATLSEHGGFS
jgi:toxin ParE1/3/4